MMVAKNLQYNFLAILGIVIFFLCLSCGSENDGPMEDRCEGIEKLEENVKVNGDDFSLSDPGFSDALLNLFQFRFEAANDDCSDVYDFIFDFNKILGFPDFSLTGTYNVTSVNNVIELEENEVSVVFGLNGLATDRLVSGTATLTENLDETITISLDGRDADQMDVDVELTYQFR